MCIYKTRILNKRFLPTKKNWYNPPVCTDERLRYIEVECGYCHDCLKKKGREWRIRNYEQLKETPTAVFFTGTFTDERIKTLCERYSISEDDANGIATKEVRLFLERIRKYNKGKSVKHWIVTEKGHTNTRRIHIHGIFYAENGHTKQSLTWLLKKQWIAGYSYNGKYVNEKTINYVSKYLTKIDEDNREFRGIVLCSKGLGRGYAERNKRKHQWNGEMTKINYHTSNGRDIALPRYYKLKLFTEDQREQLWIWRENSGEKYVNGFKLYVKTEEDLKYYRTLENQRKAEVEGMYKECISMVETKRSANRDIRRQRYHQKLKEYYGKELRQRQRADRDLCADLNEWASSWARANLEVLRVP